jgi:hypothetical protein
LSLEANMRLTSSLILVAFLTSGCAHHVAVARAPRLTLGYTDRDHLFAVEMRHAYPAPRGPSSGLRAFAAQMGGNVCGTDIAYEAEYWGRFMSVTGFAMNSHSQGDTTSIVLLNSKGDTAMVGGQGSQRPVELEVRDRVRNGVSERLLRGSVGQIAGMVSSGRLSTRNPPGHGVDLRFNRDELVGEVGLRRYDLHRMGDDLAGYFTMYGKRVPYVVRGADELWSMPPAAQAAILPLLLTCTEETKVIQRVDFRN